MTSLRRAVNEMCKSCLYDPRGGGGSWRQQVEACTSPGCPLFEVRPRSTARREPVDLEHADQGEVVDD